MLFVPKKDETLQICVDCCIHNAVTKRDLYSISSIDKYVGSRGKAAMSSTSDANNGYRQIEIEDFGKEKTAFVAHHGIYRFVRMLFGYSSTPKTFQRTMHAILYRVNWQFNFVYL